MKYRPTASLGRFKKAFGPSPTSDLYWAIYYYDLWQKRLKHDNPPGDAEELMWQYLVFAAYHGELVES